MCVSRRQRTKKATVRTGLISEVIKKYNSNEIESNAARNINNDILYDPLEPPFEFTRRQIEFDVEKKL